MTSPYLYIQNGSKLMNSPLLYRGSDARPLRGKGWFPPIGERVPAISIPPKKERVSPIGGRTGSP